MSTIKHANTIRLSDTIDQFARRVHVNVRDGKVTMVYRWKDHRSSKAHTQRVTLDDSQAGRLFGALTAAADKVIGYDELRARAFTVGAESILEPK